MRRRRPRRQRRACRRRSERSIARTKIASQLGVVARPNAHPELVSLGAAAQVLFVVSQTLPAAQSSLLAQAVPHVPSVVHR